MLVQPLFYLTCAAEAVVAAAENKLNDSYENHTYKINHGWCCKHESKRIKKLVAFCL